MSPRTKEQFESIREEKKKLIFETALDLFALEGYHSTSINKIAKKANISKGLLYNYFESKEALLIEILTSGFNEMMQNFDPNQDEVLSEEEMLNFLTSLFTMLKENNQYWKLYYAIFFQPDVYELIKDQLAELFTGMMKILTNYYSHHGLKEPEKEALVFGCLIDGVAFNYVMNPDLFPIEVLKDYIIKKFCYIKK